jgi:glutamine cyclotransferase
VEDDSSPLSSLNELEYVDGELLANVYRSTWIVRIDPTSGQVLGWLDCADLVPEHLRGLQDEVLNGIALDSATGQVLVTGKRWPLLYRLQLESPTGGS